MRNTYNAVDLIFPFEGLVGFQLHIPFPHFNVSHFQSPVEITIRCTCVVFPESAVKTEGADAGNDKKRVASAEEQVPVSDPPPSQQPSDTSDGYSLYRKLYSPLNKRSSTQTVETTSN